MNYKMLKITIRSIPLILLVGIVGLYSCGTAKDTNAVNNSEDVVIAADPSRDLTNILKARTGVRLIGTGAGAQVTIRGFNSLTTSTEPLYVFDDQIVNSYAELYRMAAPSRIKDVEVLKTPDEVGPWGMRGSNGVIRVISLD